MIATINHSCSLSNIWIEVNQTKIFDKHNQLQENVFENWKLFSDSKFQNFQLLIGYVDRYSGSEMDNADDNGALAHKRHLCANETNVAPPWTIDYCG